MHGFVYSSILHHERLILGTDTGLVEIQEDDKKIEFQAHSTRVTGLCMADTFLVSASGSELKFWQLSIVMTQENNVQPEASFLFDQRIVSLVFHTSLLYIVLEAEILVYSITDMSQIRKCGRIPDTKIHACCMLGQRRLIVSYSDSTIRIFSENGTEDQVIHTLERIMCVACSADQVFAGSDAGTFYAYDLSTNSFSCQIQVTNVPIQKIFVAGDHPYVSTVSSVYKIVVASKSIDRIYTEELRDIIDLAATEQDVFILTNLGTKKISLIERVETLPRGMRKSRSTQIIRTNSESPSPAPRLSLRDNIDSAYVPSPSKSPRQMLFTVTDTEDIQNAYSKLEEEYLSLKSSFTSVLDSLFRHAESDVRESKRLAEGVYRLLRDPLRRRERASDLYPFMKSQRRIWDQDDEFDSDIEDDEREVEIKMDTVERTVSNAEIIFAKEEEKPEMIATPAIRVDTTLKKEADKAVLVEDHPLTPVPARIRQESEKLGVKIDFSFSDSEPPASPENLRVPPPSQLTTPGISPEKRTAPRNRSPVNVGLLERDSSVSSKRVSWFPSLSNPDSRAGSRRGSDAYQTLPKADLREIFPSLDQLEAEDFGRSEISLEEKKGFFSYWFSSRKSST